MSNRSNRTIRIPICKEQYDKIAKNPESFRRQCDAIIKKYPELFPAEILTGYQLKDKRFSKKLQIPIRRIKVGDISYTVHPSFVTPYLTGITDDVEKPLFLRKFNVAYWALAYVFGRNASYWYRMENQIGRFSLTGTTVKDPKKLPKNLACDEKHTKLRGKKHYVPTVAGSGCILGASVCESAGTEALTRAYGVFKKEAQNLNPDYVPATCNIDGWNATRNALQILFPTVCIIYCFLHVFIKIRDRSRKKHKELFRETASKLWDCFKAPNRLSFSQRIRRLAEKGEKDDLPGVILKPIQKLRKNITDYSIAYKHPGALRTSNMVDRLMQGMDRHLFATRYFHGSIQAAELNIRGWALINNFATQNPATVRKHHGLKSPAEQLNGRRYHECWLQNLLISGSLGGYR